MMQRRQFIKNSSIAISAMPLLGSTFNFLPKRIALIGTGWWGMNILNEAIAFGNCKIVGLCDVDKNALQKAQQSVQKANGDTPKMYADFRDLISTEKPNIVIVATPDHWHALIAIEAINSGADVFLEKPIGHTIKEGRAIVNAARRNGSKVQVDTHRRMSSHNISAMEFLRSGKMGKITQVKAFVNYPQGPGKVTPDSDVPEGLDWESWIGPAPYRPYNSNIHPKGFRQYLDFANGQMGDWGIHWFDQVLWWTEEKFPKNIFSTGGRFIKEDGTDAPDTQLATYAFESFDLSWEHKLCAINANEKHNIGCYFYGTEGTLHLGWADGWTFYPRNKKLETIHVEAKLNRPDWQNIKEAWQDFIEAIEQDRLPKCDIEVGHLSSNVSLLAMISYKIGRSIKWDGDKEIIVDDAAANEYLSREYRGHWQYPQ